MTTQPTNADAILRIQTELHERHTRKIKGTKHELERAKHIIERMLAAIDQIDYQTGSLGSALDTDDFFRLDEALLAARATEAQAREIAYLTKHVLPNGLEDVDNHAGKYLVAMRPKNRALRSGSSMRFARIMRNGRTTFEFDPSRGTVFESKARALEFCLELREANPDQLYWAASLSVCKENHATSSAHWNTKKEQEVEA